MELMNLKDLNLSTDESRDIIKFIAQKRGISTKHLLSTIKPNPKHKNNEILTTKLPRKVAKIPRKVAKLEINQNLTLHRPIKIAKRRTAKNLTPQKSLKLEKRKNTQNLTYEKPLKLANGKNLTPQKPLKTIKQQILSKTKKRIEIIREKL